MVVRAWVPSLRALLALAFAALALVTVAGTSLLAGREADSRSAATASRHLRAVAETLADTLDRGMFERWRDIAIAAALPSMRNPDLPVEARRAILRQLHDTYPDYALLAFMDPTGRVVADSRGLIEGADASRRTIFQQGRERTTVEDVHEAMMLARLLPPTADGLPPRFVDIAAPVRAEDGTLIGIVAGHLYWSWAERIARRFREIAGPGEGVETMILGAGGTVLLGPPGLVGTALPPAASVRGAVRWPDGREYRTEWAQTRGHLDYPGLGWSVLVRQPAEVAAIEAEGYARLIGLNGLLAIVLAAPLGWLLAWWIARPLMALASTSARAHEYGDAVGFPNGAGGAPYREARDLARALGRLVGGLREGREAHATLVREADHRLKNSLQTVASMLSAHARTTDDAGARAAFGEAIVRVRTIAEVHRALYRSDGLPGEAVDLGRMLRDLVEAHASVALRPGVDVECIAPDGLLVAGRQAMAIGLLTAELITNAGKHAFPGGRTGTVRVSLERHEGVLALAVEDDGAGMADPAGAGTGLGRGLVTGLARQAGGTVEVSSTVGVGTRVVVRLKRGMPPPPNASLQKMGRALGE
jgi:two-component sensor histidine kinase